MILTTYSARHKSHLSPVYPRQADQQHFPDISSRQLLQHQVEAVVVKVDGGIHRTRKERAAGEENPALGRLLGTTNVGSVRNAAAVNRRQCGWCLQLSIK
ncbi:hypothetical protein M747DRAFT_169773 [Aspergillus niger ATCC 13496]|uniref:Uncharacterized protein n=1 Tax=Aspergillus niger ATCC 13496 TaxID=1353008 RepID=A0A370BFC5_ASPNG|nr:hypothetical protein M747DRAFT_169773 [Aspergillus niger ATCC 13496]